MKKETRTVVYDDELRIEAYRFAGIYKIKRNYAIPLFGNSPYQ
jgi:hypothetical protein